MAQVRKIGHLGVFVSDTAHTEAFYTRNFGLRTTEYNDLGLTFMRAGRDHHDLVVFPAKPGQKLGLEHIAFEVANVAEFVEVLRVLKEKKVTLVRGPGWRDQGHHIDIYFLDPDGNLTEVFCNTDQIPEGQYPEETISRYRTLKFL